MAFPILRELRLPAYPTRGSRAATSPPCGWPAHRRLAALSTLHRKDLPHMTQIAASGLTEATSYTSMNRASDDEESRLYAHGQPLPGVELRIVDPETGAELAPGERGELPRAASADSPATTATEGDGSRHRRRRLAAHRRRRHDRRPWLPHVRGRSRTCSRSAARTWPPPNRHPAPTRRWPSAQAVAVSDARLRRGPAAFVELSWAPSVDEHELIAHCVGRMSLRLRCRWRRADRSESPMSGKTIPQGRPAHADRRGTGAARHHGGTPHRRSTPTGPAPAT